MTKDQTLYLTHIAQCNAKILEYTKGMSEETFLHNSLVQDAVIRNFEIIGEATKHLSVDFRNMHPEIEWKKIAGMRDKLIHDYIGVDIWAVGQWSKGYCQFFQSRLSQLLKAKAVNIKSQIEQINRGLTCSIIRKFYKPTPKNVHQNYTQ